MDCNREEALRAKQLAEKKMEIKDFYGALKIAVKAQQLYPELENVSQMIVVCEVHCSAEKKSYGTDKDWYGILKIEPSADDISIKKQYRKLALVLHPDKNKFSGSTDAFKLIGEAQRVLLDREKRLIYDSKRRASVNFTAPKWNTRQPTSQPNVPQQHPWNQSHSASYTGGRAGSFPFSQQAPTGVSGKGATFWTGCPFCKVRYQFYREDAYNKDVNCQSCKKSFTAYELNPQGFPSAGAPNTVYPQQSRVPPKSTEAPKRTYTTKPVFEKKEPKITKAQKNVNRKRKKRIEESSESSDSSESSSESEEDVIEHSGSNDNSMPKTVDKNSDYQGFEHFGEQPRRSSRAKRNVSYKENLNDNDNDDYDTSSKQAKKSDTPEHTAHESSRKEKVTKIVEEVQTKKHVDKKSMQDDKEHPKSESDDKGEETGNDDDNEEEIESKTFVCPDPEFSDFEKDRKEESFAAKQIWACYDTLDAMPRFYAFIKKVSPGFKLQIQWLKPDPGTPDEKKWVQNDLPVSCGVYKRDKADKAEDILSFSHLVSWEAGQKAGTFIIIPRLGDTWAIFRNWSMNWHSSIEVDEVEEERTYEYDFVEILSDYDAKNGIRVSYLEKVKGFVCLFKRKEGGEMVIAAADRYRFAHMVPSSRMSGEERKGVPKGSYELDPAGLPQSAFE
uniref:J protein JJJ2-like n=1 Tax=Erigeron canadensis TaxID=72917 RepID=UPI001CB98408|nr:J protein JJJ2-like [Erigeron canadensis]XP_043628399.1 J protein JJJ2-like [Erigeron canadensis]